MLKTVFAMLVLTAVSSTAYAQIFKGPNPRYVHGYSDGWPYDGPVFASQADCAPSHAEVVWGPHNELLGYRPLDLSGGN